MLRKPSAVTLAFGLFLGVLLITSLVRQSTDTQIVLPGDVYVSWQFVALVPFALLGIPWIVLRLWQETPISLLAGGPLFFVYAISVDWLRNGERLSALAVDSAQVAVPILAAISVFGKRTPAERHHMTRCLVILLVAILTAYALVALLVHTFDFGDMVISRPPGHENMTFVRLSGPLGVSTGLSMILLPAMGFAWQEGRRKASYALFWKFAAILLGFYILWTASRLTPLFLGAFLLFACSARQILLLAYTGLAVGLAVNLPESFIPEKWIRLGFSDPGRSMAFDTTWAAFTSSWSSILVGVGSDRLNVLSQTVSQVARGEIRFNSWNTDFGDFPYGPHSVLWWSLGSYGIMGALLRCAPFLAPWGKAIAAIVGRRVSLQRLPLVFFSVLISGIGFFFDDTHITHPYLMCVWYLMCLHAVDGFEASLRRTSKQREIVLQEPALAGAASA